MYWLVFVFVVIGVGVTFYYLTPASAFIVDKVLPFIGDIVLKILNWLLHYVALILSWIAIKVFALVLIVSSYDNFFGLEAINKGWVIIRDLTNMFLVVILLVIGFTTILQLEKYSVKKMLPKVLIAAVLVNFSKLIAALIVDASQVVMLTFVNAFQQAAGANFIKGLGLEKLYSMKNAETMKPAALALNYGLVLIMLLLTIGVSIILAGVLAFRIAYIWILVVLSPLAYVFNILPKTSSYSKKWWDKFINQVVVGPVLAFFLWLSLLVMSMHGDYLKGYDAALKTGISGGNNVIEGVNYDSLVSFLLSITLLYGSIMITKELGATAGGLVGKVEGAGKKLTGYLKKAQTATVKGAKKATGIQFAQDSYKGYRKKVREAKDKRYQEKVTKATDKLYRGREKVTSYAREKAGVAVDTVKTVAGGVVLGVAGGAVAGPVVATVLGALGLAGGAAIATETGDPRKVKGRLSLAQIKKRSVERAGREALDKEEVDKESERMKSLSKSDIEEILEKKIYEKMSKFEKVAFAKKAVEVDVLGDEPAGNAPQEEKDAHEALKTSLKELIKEAGGGFKDKKTGDVKNQTVIKEFEKIMKSKNPELFYDLSIASNEDFKSFKKDMAGNKIDLSKLSAAVFNEHVLEAMADQFGKKLGGVMKNVVMKDRSDADKQKIEAKLKNYVSANVTSAIDGNGNIDVSHKALIDLTGDISVTESSQSGDGAEAIKKYMEKLKSSEISKLNDDAFNNSNVVTNMSVAQAKKLLQDNRAAFNNFKNTLNGLVTETKDVDTDKNGKQIITYTYSGIGSDLRRRLANTPGVKDAMR